MSWDVEYWDRDTQTGYRIRARALRIRDAIAVDSEQDAIANDRMDVAGRAFMALMDYPLLKHATAECERVTLPDFEPADPDTPTFPDDAMWEAFDLDEALFNDLPEYLFWAWYSAIITRNPHRDRRYDVLKKRLAMEQQPTANVPSTSANSSSENPSDPTSPAS
jgi:hypothetical protein